MKKLCLLFLIFTICWTSFAEESSNKKKRDVGYGSGGLFYSVEYEEKDDAAYFIIVVTTQDGSKAIMKMYSKEQKDAVKQLFNKKSKPDELLMIMSAYSSLCETEEETDDIMIVSLNLDDYGSNNSASNNSNSNDSDSQIQFR